MFTKVTFIVSAVLVSTSVAFAQSAIPDARTFEARLDCSALSSSPEKHGSFTTPLTISFAKGSLTAERPLISGLGKEQFAGWIDPLGRIEMTGKYEEGQSWAYKLKGQLSDKKPTVLVGDLEVINGTRGHRACSLIFLPKPDELMGIFSY